MRINPLLLLLSLCLPLPAAPVVPDKVRPAIADRQDAQTPENVQLRGWLGERIAVNEANRLVKLDPDRLLEGYRKRPGRQAWDGEHVGKWLHAATLAWSYTGDPALRQKLSLVANELCKCQLDDGYLGTYLDKDRWTEWDVWAHKYNLIGLVTYMRYTGDLSPLPTCRRMADLLCRTFGDEPGKRDIIQAGYHVGLAPTSVLEPMVLMYRFTGEARYLDFCHYILRAWEQPDGPKVISTLLTQKRVDQVGNGKAYEMLSCLNGALELYRTTGEPQLLQACLNAWQDIVEHRLYITGAASYHEVFHGDYDLPNVSNVGETCVTVTWLQFNAQLLRLLGEARFGDQLEKVVLNQLFGAQQCDGSAWGYYVQMQGKKPYTSSLDGQCCLSSGPRGVALIPTFAVTTDAEGLVFNLYDPGLARLTLRDGTTVKVAVDTIYPADGNIRFTLDPAQPASFTLKVRVPQWCKEWGLRVNGSKVKTIACPEGYAAVRREWRKGDQVTLRLELEPRVVVGDHSNAGKIAVAYGPLVLAADAGLTRETAGGDPVPLRCVAAAGATLSDLKITPEPAPAEFKSWPGARVFRMRAITRYPTAKLRPGDKIAIRLVPFADAGSTGKDYQVWLPLPPAKTALHGVGSPANLLLQGRESRSRPGNLDASINDDELQTFAVTFDNKPAAQDWFQVTLDQPVTVRRIVFAHGHAFHDGGWFDASAGQPKVLAKLSQDGSWEPVGELRSYPATTAQSSATLKDGERFECALPNAVALWAVRVSGKPACGDNPRQAFASCAELQAFQ